MATAVALTTFTAATPAMAQQFEVLYYVGSVIYSNGLVRDASGNLYGTTTNGGTDNAGIVYELSPQSDGTWTETVLHNFDGSFDGSADGYEPYAGLAIDSAGNLYGTTRGGGPSGLGTVFEMSPGGAGTWTETILYNFGSTSTDGIGPYAPVVLDSEGNLYGTTLLGGTGQSGTVFKLVHGANGWHEKVIHNFVPNAQGDGGFNPYGGVILDSAGNLYGTTTSCQCSYTNRGTVFELKRSAAGSYAEKVLHYFYSGGVDGYDPRASLAFDKRGNLYGTTDQGGTSSYGTVFELSPTASGNWKEKVIHNFTDPTTDGQSPEAGVTFDAHGNLYGTTYGGGINGYGIVFELTHSTSGSWNEVILHNFDGADGGEFVSPVILDSSGNLFGAGAGIVFEIMP
jgi:uncharacterized repeat protein (TIGR03803 family)